MDAHGDGRTRSVLAVFGSGGHTAEMIALLGSLPRNRYAPRTLLVSATDASSLPRATAAGCLHDDDVILRIPRTREVGGSFVVGALRTVWVSLLCTHILMRTRPALVLTNGPGVCLPVCLAAVVLKILCTLLVLLCCGAAPAPVRALAHTRVVFVESLARVYSLSITGRILYNMRICDSFCVQWPQLQQRYPRTRYIGMML